ncbi:NmrA-like family domain-containing protein 1 [Lipomyces doorenjongii]
MGAQTVLVIGGTGAQGEPIVEDLASRGYNVRVLTRSDGTPTAQHLAYLPRVQLHLGSPYDENTLRSAFRGVDLAFVNTNSFAIGIRNEVWWGIRVFEIATQSGVKHYVWSSLDNYFHDTLYDESLRVAHYYGKGIVEQWMSTIPQTPMRWSVLTTGPYIETLSEFMRPVQQDGVTVFRAPLADGAVPFVHLNDLGFYVDWIFSHPDASAGMNLKVAVEHVSFQDLANEFTNFTGKPARYENISFEEYFSTGPLAQTASAKLGAEGAGEDDPSLLTYQQNFTAWWRLYQLSGGNKGLIRRDYELLDKIHPERVRTVKQWMEKVGYTGEYEPVVKTYRAA